MAMLDLFTGDIGGWFMSAGLALVVAWMIIDERRGRK